MENYNANTTNHTVSPTIDFNNPTTHFILGGLPCVFLWVFSFLEIYYIQTYRQIANIKWGFLYTTKTLATLILVLVKVVSLYVMITNFMNHLLIITSIVQVFTIILSWILMFFNKRHGIRSSGILYIFWATLLIFAIPQLLLEIVNYVEQQNTIKFLDKFQFYNSVGSYVIILLILILNSFADQSTNNNNNNNDDDDDDEDATTINGRPCPEYFSSFLNRIFYHWYDGLTWMGYRRPIEMDDIWDLNYENRGKNLIPKFDKHLFSKKKISILPAIMKAFGGQFWMAGFIRLFMITCQFISPFLLRLLIQYVGNGGPLWEGFLYAITLFVCSLLSALLTAQHFHRTYNVGLRTRTALVSAIYRKALRLSSTAKQTTTVGEIVNLMAIDSQRFFDTLLNIHVLWAGPLTIGIAVYFLWGLLGPASMSGLALMILLIPVNIWIARKLKNLQHKHMKIKDERIKLMNEVLSGIKVLKLYAWEISFEKQINAIREEDIKILRKKAWLQTAKYFLWSILPFFVGFVSFLTFVLIDEGNVLNAEIAFVSMAYFNILRFPMSIFPIVITNVLQILVSTKRINDFLSADELIPENVLKTKSENAITIENGKFMWGDMSEFILDQINIKVPKGGLYALVGPVGSGKSSSIAAVLGEMNKLNGTVNVDGSVAYVAQQAWIQNATLQNNILFGKAYNPDYYNKVIDACALTYDFEILPAGDQTEIGEKGINLSGGQKQRVSLARAVYSEADIYLFDDPLSAVDSNVGKHIFDHVIGPNGLLAGKTRFLVTHGISYLPFVDQIIVLNNGTITSVGSYKDFTNQENTYSDAFITFLNGLSTDDEKNIESNENTNISDEIEIDIDEKIKITPKLKQVETSKLIKKETVETGNVGLKIYMKYFRSVGVWFTGMIAFMMILTQASSIYSNVWLAKWVNDPKAAAKNVRDEYLGVFGALGISQSITLYVSTTFLAIGSLRACRNFHSKLLHKILRLPMCFFDATPIGRIINRFSRDIDIVDDDIPLAIRIWILTFFIVISIFVIIIYSTPMFFVVMIPIGIMYYFILVVHVTSSRQIIRLQSVTRSPIYSHFSESITGQSTIRAYNAQDRFVQESEKRMDFNQKFSYLTIIANRWIGVRLETVGSMVILFAAVFAIMERDHISPAIVGLSISYALQITNMLNILVRTTTEMETKIVSVERIEEYSNLEQEADWERPKDDINWPRRGTIEFKDFRLRYRKELQPVLEDITLKIEDGEKIGIVGRTGSGKSSLTMALFRIIEADSGKIIIDNKTIENVGLYALRSKITIIPQDPFLFSGTLRVNIDPFSMHTDEEIWRALEHAHLKEFVSGLSNGLWCRVAEGGENLSVGQRQLICLARALLRKSKILILDEATAAIDYETDNLIQETIRSEFKDCTVLTIAHRLNTILDADRILVLDNGRIVEFDKPAVLLANPGSSFYRMAKKSSII